MKKLEVATNGSFRERELVALHALSREVPNIDAARGLNRALFGRVNLTAGNYSRLERYPWRRSEARRKKHAYGQGKQASIGLCQACRAAEYRRPILVFASSLDF
jgi:hypothetical protein